MRTKELAPTLNNLPDELAVAHYEAVAAGLRERESRRIIHRCVLGLLNFWTETGPALIRESRQRAMHPDKPRAESLRELGLEPFLGR